MKAVFITDKGVFAYNLASGALTETELEDCMESRIEVIARQISGVWEQELLECIS